jgi:hypothetical protein
MKIKELEWRDPDDHGYMIAYGFGNGEFYGWINTNRGKIVPWQLWSIDPDDDEVASGECATIDEAKSACNAAHAKLFEGWVLD